MGLNPLLQNQQQQSGGIERLAGNSMYPQSQQVQTQFATPTQMPTSAEVVDSDYDPKTDAYTGMPTKPFAAGGIASIPRYSGADGSDVQAPAPWDPASGQVTLQQLDPTGQADPKSVAYTIPKDSIKTFVANTNDNGQEDPSLGGKYILNDGSSMIVGGDGTVTAATPARNEYTLNKDGYYQPTGSDLTWNGQANLLTKNIGGVDVQVPGMYTKGGYQDAQGNLRTDANGTPVPLAPNYLDSGSGKSTLNDYAPLMAIAALTAGAGLAGAGATGFTGMVPASETLMGGIGGAAATGAGEAATTAEGATAGEAASQGMSLKDAYNAYKYANLAKNAMGLLSGAAGGMGGQSGSQGIAGGQGINPMASTGFNPGPARSGLGITDATSASNAANAWSNLEPSINLSKISDFKYGATPSYATGGMAHGGGIANLGSYSDGGQLLKGPGDGMSDHIPATIGDKQPARLAEGEFVVPADVVSHLGNGSTDAGAKQLYKMMDNIRKARTGNPKQGKQINPAKFLPKG